MRIGAGQEAKTLLVVALPLVFAYLSEVLMVATAKMVVGRLGYVELAAAGISTDLSYQMCIILMGLFSVVGVQVSEALGAKRREEAVPDLARGLLLAGILGLCAAIMVYNLDVILHATAQEPAVVAAAQPFYQTFALAMLPIVWFGVLRSFVSALLRTGFVMGITIAAVGMNYVLMWGFVHGAYGFPRLGISGAGLAWGLTMWTKLFCLLAYTLWLIRREKLPANRPSWFVRLSDFAPLIRLGLPVAGIVALESGLFAATALLSGWLGATELAAYQMLMAWIAIPFVISLAMGEAAMVRVAYWMGAGVPSHARRAGNLGMAIGVAVPLALIAVPLAAPQIVTLAFLDPADSGFAAISALVVNLLFIAAILQVFDGLQAIASHALRGLRDATMPLVIAGIGYWIIGLGSAYVLCFPLGMGSEGLWWGLALGLAFTGVFLAVRFERLAKRGLVADVIGG